MRPCRSAPATSPCSSLDARIDLERAAPQLERGRATTGAAQHPTARGEPGDEPRPERLGVGDGRGEEANQLAARIVEAGVGQIFDELAAQLAHVGVARRLVLGHRPRDDRRELAADARVHRVRRRVDALADSLQHLVRVLAAEGQLPGRQLIEQDADGEHVGAKVDAAALDVLGRHVRGRAEELARHRHALLVDHLRDAEVGELDEPVVADHHVLGLHVAVDDAGLVRVLERARDLADDELGDLGVLPRTFACVCMNARSVVPWMNSVTMKLLSESLPE